MHECIWYSINITLNQTLDFSKYFVWGFSVKGWVLHHPIFSFIYPRYVLKRMVVFLVIDILKVISSIEFVQSLPLMIDFPVIQILNIYFFCPEERWTFNFLKINRGIAPRRIITGFNACPVKIALGQ